jgi:fermentation-respiration switch protein FrsA (DUF1100 family)
MIGKGVMVEWLWYLGGGLALLYIAWGVVLLLMQPRLLYRPTREISGTPADLSLEYEDVAFQSADGVRLTGWYLAVKNARFTLLFCHGNGGNIMHRLDSLALFHSLGVNCFIFDYRGYGSSAGRPTEAGTYLDAQAAYDWLIREKRIPPEQIILFGRSLGGSIAAHLAGRVRSRALVVESAFTSYPDIGARFYPYMPVRLFARFRYSTLTYLKRVHCPVMLIHSKDDELVPLEFGRRLFEAAQEPKQFVEIAGGHNDGFVVSGDVYREAWARWLDFVEDYQKEVAVHKAS